MRPYYINDWANFTGSRERILDMAKLCAESFSLPQSDLQNPFALYTQRWRKAVWGDGKFVTAKYYSEWDENKTGTFLRAEWIEEWMKYHRSFCDAAPKLCTTREDDAQVGYRF